MPDQLLSFTPDGRQWAWDSTSLSTFVTCPRKYLYSMLQGWQAQSKSVHLIFGGHYAKALERFHKLRADGADFDEAQLEVVRLCLLETWDSEADAPQDWGDSKKTRDTLIRSIVWYLENYRDDPMQTVILANGKPAVELSFTVELTSDLVYCGHMDRLVTYGADSDIYVQDQKSTGSALTSYYFDGYSPDYQMTGYTYAGQVIFNLPVKGVIIDAAQIAVGFTNFARAPVLRSNKSLDEFVEEVKHYTAEANRCHEENYYPMRRTACGNYGGCEFRKVCALNPALRPQYLAGNYKKRERWDPLKKR